MTDQDLAVARMLIEQWTAKTANRHESPPEQERRRRQEATYEGMLEAVAACGYGGAQAQALVELLLTDTLDELPTPDQGKVPPYVFRAWQIRQVELFARKLSTTRLAPQAVMS